MKNFFCRQLLLSLWCLPVHGQVKAPASLTRDINRVFEREYSVDAPGFAVDIVRDDQLIFTSGYGMANLDYRLPKRLYISPIC